MPTERTIEIRGSAGAVFHRRSLKIDFLGDTFDLTAVRITPSIEHALKVDFSDEEFSGRILIDKDET